MVTDFCGGLGTAVSADEGEEVVGDGEVGGFCGVDEIVFFVGGDAEGEGGGCGCFFGGGVRVLRSCFECSGFGGLV